MASRILSGSFVVLVFVMVKLSKASVIDNRVDDSLSRSAGDIKTLFWGSNTVGDDTNPPSNDPAAPDSTERMGRRLWPNGIIPWSVDPTSPVGTHIRLLIRDAVAAIERRTCIKMPEVVPGSVEHMLHFRQSWGCSSSIGRSGGVQFIDLGFQCHRFGYIMHEMFHAMGFYHEHARNDRDNYIKVNMSNVIRGRESQFQKRSHAQNVAPFDESSILMYGPYTFSKNHFPTIQAVDPTLNNLMGQRFAPSFYDWMTINLAYQCSDHCTNQCQNGGYLQRDCSCACPKGLGGTSCDRLDNTQFSCGYMKSIGVGEHHLFSSENFPAKMKGPKECAWIFVSPPGSYLQLDFHTLKMDNHNRAYCRDYIEIRSNLPGQRGVTYCQKPNKQFTTLLKGQTILTLFMMVESSEFIQGFQATVTAKYPSACSSSPCFNQARCVDHGSQTSNYKCLCTDGTLGGRCQFVDEATLTIDFEQGLDPMSQLEEDDLNWELRTGPTPSYGTGPEKAHQGETYIYVEASGNHNGKAVLSSPTIIGTKRRKLSFYYHMYGEHQGSLSAVQHFTDGHEQVLWRQSGNQGPLWKNAELALPVSSTPYQIHFKATIGPKFWSDMALDTILIEPQAVAIPTKPDHSHAATESSNIVRQVLLDQDFETDFSGFENTGGHYKWIMQAGRTPSSSTGPISAHNGQYYIYLEASYPMRHDDTCVLTTSKEFTTDVCVRFYRCMNGWAMGRLDVGIVVHGQFTVLNTYDKDEGETWTKEKISVTNPGSPFTVRFVGVRGISWRSDIALDSIQITSGQCQDD